MNANTLNTLILVAAIVVSIGALVAWLWWRRDQRLLKELDDLRRHQPAASERHGDPAPAPQEPLSSDVPVRSVAERRGIYISHSATDREIVDRLIIHIRPILRGYELLRMETSEGRSVDRTQRREWLARSAASIVVVSPDYLVLDDGNEVEAVIEARERYEVALLWFAAKPSAVESTRLAEYQALINPGEALSLLDPQRRELALVTIAESLRRSLERLQTSAGDRGRPEMRTDSGPRLHAIRLKNIRCFEALELELDVKTDHQPNPLPSLRTVLVGDNATGKSTLLRAIALGFCDESGAAALLKKMTGRMVRTGTNEGTIELIFRTDGSDRTSTSVTRITNSGGTEVVRKSGDPPVPLLVVGYGTQRARSGTESHSAYDTSNAVATLFDLDAKLQNPELVLLRQPRWVRRDINTVIAGILGLQSDEVDYQRDAIQIKGPWGQERLDVLSDGYRSTTQWILDLVNWITFAESTARLNELTGLVLIDELEQHLHPQWQRKILSRLRTHLPRMQFFITTHSPLIASSVTGLDESTDGGWREKLIYLGANERGTVVPTESEPLRGLTVQQVLASPAFDYLIEAEPSVAAVYEEASRLASKASGRSPEEEMRYKRIKRIVGEMIVDQDHTVVERETRRELNEKAEAKIAQLEKEVFGEKR